DGGPKWKVPCRLPLPLLLHPPPYDWNLLPLASNKIKRLWSELLHPLSLRRLPPPSLTLSLTAMLCGPCLVTSSMVSVVVPSLKVWLLTSAILSTVILGFCADTTVTGIVPFSDLMRLPVVEGWSMAFTGCVNDRPMPPPQ